MAEKNQRGFEDLECYQLALEVLREAYRVSGRLPSEERYNLSDQLRRAATSIVLNIAEGYGRYHFLDSLRFFYTARGSLSEVLSAFVVCDAVQYTTGDLSHQRQICHTAFRAQNGYIRYVREQQQGRAEFGDRALHEDRMLYEVAYPSSNEP